MLANSQKKILVIGLDSMPDTEVFEKRKDELPNLKKMIDNGIYGTLKSCHPPIAVPAWRVMMSSKSPGKLGVYGFRHRKGYSYKDGWFTTSNAFKESMIWDILEKFDKKSYLVGVPPSYPPFKINGNLISCFITPKDKTSGFTYPPELSCHSWIGLFSGETGSDHLEPSSACPCDPYGRRQGRERRATATQDKNACISLVFDCRPSSGRTIAGHAPRVGIRGQLIFANLL